ncbi:zinc dependent phospholipase C family protein [Blautia sp. HCP3S3_H10_1]|uniref:zinc dependent phospholipase C family protein n=1 Tax=unclassified Blautia TaxID=2648079 RepID=UPI003F919430|nr:zinc dependent phospholipase C family protein [Clostridia bacterium]
MRKKSHILVARYLADQIPAAKSLQSHRKAFCLGSILPDIKPSFLTKKHEYFGTFEEIQNKMKTLIDSSPQEGKERVYWRRFGEVMHYMADYFTFPHNKNFTGNLYEHNKYEKHLKNHLKRYIESGAAGQIVIEPVSFDNFQELVNYIQKVHERYLLKERNIAEDVQYILRTCLQVICGILQLATKRLGRENLLLLAAC